MQTDEYSGFFAEFYDILHAGNQDVKIYPRILAAYGSKVLELGCGTGRIAIPLAQAGFDVTGLEYSPAMIALLEEKPYPKERLQVIEGDARDFSIGETFDVILLTCNFINHFLDSSDVLRILRSSRQHLKDEGVVIIDCSAPDTKGMCESSGAEEMYEFKTPRGTVIKDYFCPHYDFLRQVETDTIRLEEYGGETLVREAEARETLTYYYPREIRGLVREAGLRVIKESGRLWDGGQLIPIGQEESEMVFYCAR
jgi:SAM-dependent methyltransferase